MTQASDPDRIDRLEALAETTLLAIRELSNRQNGFEQQQTESQARLDRIEAIQTANAHQTALNTEAIAEMRAGLVELRNILADYIRSQQRS